MTGRRRSRIDATRPELWALLLSSAALAAVGLYAIDVASAGHDADGLSPLTVRQGLYIAVGVLAALFAAVPHHRRISVLAWPLYAISIAALVFLLLPFVPASIVTPRNGARAWIDLGPINLQPAEFAKIAYVLAVARYLRYRDNYRRLLGFLPPAFITFTPVALMLLQPDLGTAVMFGPALFAMLMAAGAKLKHIAAVLLLGLVLAPAAYPFLLPHQKARIVALVNQAQGDTSSSDSTQYQALKAVTLAGAGGFTGLDDAHSRAVVDFNDLPEAHNDMVFAVIVNRFGFVGGAATLALAFVWICSAALIAARSKDPFGRLVAIGLTAFVACQTVLNAAMNLGIAPIVGVTLPFVSFGGSSMLASCIAVGLLVNISIRPAQRLTRQSFEYAADE